MSKPLKDGERRVMRPGSHLPHGEKATVGITAYREDCDTPYVLIDIGYEMVRMSDSLAADVADRIKRALSVLPTSK